MSVNIRKFSIPDDMVRKMEKGEIPSSNDLKSAVERGIEHADRTD